jgi:hypothetical protein
MFDKVIQYINENSNNFIKKWSEEIQQSEFMIHYKTLPYDELSHRGEAVYLNLIKWLEEGASNDNSEQYFEAVGAERIKEGFSLTEVNYAFYLTKKVLFNSFLKENEFVKSLAPDHAVEMMFTLGNFFDLGNFFIIRGYGAQILKRLNESDKLSTEEINKIMAKDSLDDPDLDNDEIIWRHIY